MTFRFETFGNLSAPFNLMSVFESFPWKAIRLASLSADVVNDLEPIKTACILYETAKKVERGSAVHLSYSATYGIRPFEFIHSNMAEADVNNGLMALVSGRKNTLITHDSELYRFENHSFDAIVVVHETELEPAAADVTALRDSKLKTGGQIFHVRD